MLYRIFTEYKPNTIQKLYSIVSGQFPGFTIIHATGYWQGKTEPSIIFEIESDCDVGLLRNLVADIKETNQQERVMLQVITSCVRYMI